tara:strand:+ start:172 stop:486 length:315 start_codon:yes stop_codon:yes gene_type:complete
MVQYVVEYIQLPDSFNSITPQAMLSSMDEFLGELDGLERKLGVELLQPRLSVGIAQYDPPVASLIYQAKLENDDPMVQAAAKRAVREAIQASFSKSPLKYIDGS